MTGLTQTVYTEEEMIRLRRSAETKETSDIVEWLLLQRDYWASIYQTEFQKGDLADYKIINPANDLASQYNTAAEEIRKGRELVAALTESLRNRVLVQLKEAKEPAWVATHRHYKGTLYRVTGIRFDSEHEELIEKVEYDCEEGNKYVLSRRRFESHLESGKPRYEYIGLAK